MKTAALIFNPVAGGGRARRKLDKAMRLLESSGYQISLLVTREPGEATRLARESVAERRDLVIVSGGDGTINEVVNGLARTTTPMAVLPSGTANVLAKELGLPWDVQRAAELIPRCTGKRIALGLLVPTDNPERQRYFLCLGGAGPDGEMTHALNPAFKLKAGILAYWMEGFRQLFRYTFPRFQVISNGHSLEASMVVVGRTKHYGGPFQITTGAELFEDSFEVVAVTTRSPLRYLSYLPALWLGTLRGMKGIHSWKATELRCVPNGTAVRAQVDGEPAGTLAAEFRIVPDALTLMVPPRA
jgi:diacylglycerol kinase (ATP)